MTQKTSAIDIDVVDFHKKAKVRLKALTQKHTIMCGDDKQNKKEQRLSKTFNVYYELVLNGLNNFSKFEGDLAATFHVSGGEVIKMKKSISAIVKTLNDRDLKEIDSIEKWGNSIKATVDNINKALQKMTNIKDGPMKLFFATPEYISEVSRSDEKNNTTVGVKMHTKHTPNSSFRPVQNRPKDSVKRPIKTSGSSLDKETIDGHNMVKELLKQGTHLQQPTPNPVLRNDHQHQMVVSYEIESLRKEVKLKDQLIQDKETEITQLKQKMYKIKEAALTSNTDYMQKQNDEEIKQLKDLVQDLSYRLAHEMSNKMSGDETSVENVSIKNRPMNIAEEYQSFCSHSWLDAKSELDQCTRDGVSEKEILVFLCNILQNAEDECTAAYRNLLQHAGTIALRILQFPPLTQLPKINDSIHAVGKTLTEVPVSIATSLGDHMRVTADKTDLRQLVTRITELVKQDQKFKAFQRILTKKPLQAYINAAIAVTWKMAIQRPPMNFQVLGTDTKWDEKTQDPYWSCDPRKPGSKVKFYVYPTLLHGHILMAKGKVYIE